MTSHRISTTIPHKHWELLNRYVERFGTQQKVLEYALECLEKNSKKNSTLNEEDKVWNSLKFEKSLVIVDRTAFKLLIETADIKQMTEFFIQSKSVESAVEYILQKPLKECSLKEIMNGLIIVTNATKWFDSADYTDGGSHYTLRMTHSLGPNASKLNTIAFESLFKTYGVKVESTISPRTIFMKIFKSQ